MLLKHVTHEVVCSTMQNRVCRRMSMSCNMTQEAVTLLTEGLAVQATLCFIHFCPLSKCLLATNIHRSLSNSS